jgi:hypothetical protein
MVLTISSAYQPFLSSSLGSNNAHNERSCWPVSLGQECSPWASVQAGKISNTKSTAHDLTQLKGLNSLHIRTLRLRSMQNRNS